jgi:hypothetical protein
MQKPLRMGQVGTSHALSFSYADNASSNLLENHAWDDLPPDDTVTDPFSLQRRGLRHHSRPQRKYAHTWPILQRMHAPERRHDRCVGSHSPYRPSTNQARRLHHPLPLAASLPDNYQPTAVQKAVKHHPVFDLLPWPSVRSKILHILTVAHGSQTSTCKGRHAEL